MLIIAYINQIAVSVVLHYYMLRNKQFHKNSLHDIGGCVIFISNKIEYLGKKRNYKNSTKEAILSFESIFTMRINKMQNLEFHKHFEIFGAFSICGFPQLPGSSW